VTIPYLSQIKAALAVALLVGAFVGGLYVQNLRWDASIKSQAVDALAEAQQQDKENRRDVAAYQLVTQGLGRLNARLPKEVRDVTTIYVPVPGADPVPQPDALFTVGFVRVWNDKLSGAATDSAGVLGADREPSSITRADLLENTAVNAQICLGWKARLDAIDAWDKKHFPNK